MLVSFDGFVAGPNGEMDRIKVFLASCFSLCAFA